MSSIVVIVEIVQGILGMFCFYPKQTGDKNVQNVLCSDKRTVSCLISCIILVLITPKALIVTIFCTSLQDLQRSDRAQSLTRRRRDTFVWRYSLVYTNSLRFTTELSRSSTLCPCTHLCSAAAAARAKLSHQPSTPSSELIS